MMRLFVILLSVFLGSFGCLGGAVANTESDSHRGSKILTVTPPDFYLQIKKVRFPEDLITVKRRPHVLPGNTYGHEYKRRMEQERVGFVVYQCTIQENNCEAITEIVSYTELKRAQRKNSRFFFRVIPTVMLMISGFALNTVIPPAGLIVIIGGIYDLGASSGDVMDGGYLSDLLGENVYAVSSVENIVEYRDALVTITSDIVKNRR